MDILTYGWDSYIRGIKEFIEYIESLPDGEEIVGQTRKLASEFFESKHITAYGFNDK